MNKFLSYGFAGERTLEMARLVARRVCKTFVYESLLGLLQIVRESDVPLLTTVPSQLLALREFQ